MQPTFSASEWLLVNKVSYRFGRSPQRGDIVIFEPPLPSKPIYAKRVVAVAGETVAVREGKLFVNGQALAEPYLNAPPSYHYPLSRQASITVPDGHLFVLGDNRNNSADSHVFGPVAISTVKGRAEFVSSPDGWRRLP